MALSRFRKAVSWRYRRFVQRQGFVVMTVICAAIIAGSAAWTQQAGFRRMPEPTPDAASAADLWQQSLQSAATPAPSPADAQPLWQCPVGALKVEQGFDAQRLVPSGITGLWRVHDAVDLAADEGEPVAAMRDGTVLEIAEQSGMGICVVADHGDGIVAEYAGLSAAAVQPGVRVKAGEPLGTAGHPHGPNAPACLHLRVTRDGSPFDPMSLLSPSLP